MVALRLAKSGYFSGDPEKVFLGRVDLVLQALDYEIFNSDFENEYIKINNNE